MDSDTYYRDHWVEIDSDRLDAYEAMFPSGIRAWHRFLEEWVELEMGQRVLDFWVVVRGGWPWSWYGV